ncbi:uncharacterized protein LOC129729140 [Wyeomyia smithii]|uniref:uncharacterized protein LOC129729140 n=1 Tax=Wyeomyia smithii TaxID=174621 RepID=UPI0024680105|nr:uncharacterized protein LOC129729140 [Wyeomyia smithii]
MDKLLRARKSHAPRMERVTKALEKLEDAEHAEPEDVVMELDNLNSVWSSYLTVQQRILDLAETDAIYEEAMSHQIAFEEEYLALKKGLVKLQRRLGTTRTTLNQQNGGNASVIDILVQQQAQLLQALSVNAGASSSPMTLLPSPTAPPDCAPLPDLRLPRMDLPIFSGKYLEWKSFYDLFCGSVHKNPSLRPCQKLYFLKTHLAGEAATLVSHLNVEDANYLPALDKLQSRYYKPREIANLHITRFLSQPALTSSSPAGLRSLHDVSDEVIRALAALQREGRDIWLLHLVYEKLDQQTKELWSQKTMDMEESHITVDALLKFIDNRFTALQSSQSTRKCIREPNTAVPVKSQPLRHSHKLLSSALVATDKPSLSCGVCSKAGHQPYKCVFQPNGTPPTNNVTVPVAPQTPISSFNLTDHLDGSNVLLLTATVDVFDRYGRRHAARAVLDCASHLSFIRKDFCDRLAIEKSPIDLDFHGISATSSHSSMGTSVTFASRCSSYRSTIPCAVLDRISSDLPLRPVDISDWQIPDSVYLADPQFHHPGKISLLLGLQPFLDLLEPGRINLDVDGRFPILQNTKLGWVVSGRYEDSKSMKNSPTCLITSHNETLSQQLQKFFEIEDYVNPSQHLSEEKRKCEAYFEQHTTRDQAGRFEVRLPFREDPNTLGASRDIALKRLEHIERKLIKSPQLKVNYHAFLKEYLYAGHMSLAEISAPKGAVYLPHHCVLKETSSTTKCRVVFDASSKTASGKSLNDVLMTGPVLQDSLVNILLRFRTPAIALTGAVRQMYRMVKVAAADCNYQRILWRWNEKDPVDEYTLNTVTYGTKSASYLATKCVQQLLSNIAESDPDTFQKASMGIYVDDILTGADSPEEARQLRQQLSEIFSMGGFHLRKWASNHSSALEGVPEADLEVKIPIELHGSDTIKALGIHWQPCSDEFTFWYQPSKSFQPTKRIILSHIASLFDPLGLLAPIIVMAKLVMRKLWELKVDCDTTPPGELINDWLIFAQNLSSLNSFQVPRRVIDARKPVKLYLHGYSDASEKAMGA